MKRLFGTLTVLLALTLSSLAQDTSGRGRADQVPVSGQMPGTNDNLFVCQHFRCFYLARFLRGQLRVVTVIPAVSAIGQVALGGLDVIALS